jgi:hypothetical protein
VSSRRRPGQRPPRAQPRTPTNSSSPRSNRRPPPDLPRPGREIETFVLPAGLQARAPLPARRQRPRRSARLPPWRHRPTEFQSLAAGSAVALPNLRGSATYGERPSARPASKTGAAWTRTSSPASTSSSSKASLTRPPLHRRLLVRRVHGELGQGHTNASGPPWSAPAPISYDVRHQRHPLFDMHEIGGIPSSA